MAIIWRGRLVGSEIPVELRTTGSVISGLDELVSASNEASYLAPGFIDLQVNGFAGVDYNDPESSTESIRASIEYQFQTGVTRLLPTIITGSQERMLASVANLARARRTLIDDGRPEAFAMAGLHIEGPFLSPEDGPRGAHPREHIRRPDAGEFDRWQAASDGLVKLVTVSPEWPEAPAFISHVTRQGVVASIGHTAASGAQIALAVEAGATMSTHLGNAAHPVLSKTDNYIWQQLSEDRLAPSLIADGFHLPTAFFRTAVRAKGTERSVLVTDAVMPAGCLPGAYRLGQVDVTLEPSGRVVLTGQNRLAGSTLRMDHAISWAVREGGLPLRDAVVMASINPGRSGRIGSRLRGLTPGDQADVVRFDWDPDQKKLTVKSTMLAGHVVYEALTDAKNAQTAVTSP